MKSGGNMLPLYGYMQTNLVKYFFAVLRRVPQVGHCDLRKSIGSELVMFANTWAYFITIH